jgi:beta-galactosidase
LTVNNIGPQTKFPVPEGILNYKGENTVALTLWALDEAGASVKGFRLEADGIIQSGYKKPGLANLAGWQERPDAY